MDSYNGICDHIEIITIHFFFVISRKDFTTLSRFFFIVGLFLSRDFCFLYIQIHPYSIIANPSKWMQWQCDAMPSIDGDLMLVQSYGIPSKRIAPSLKCITKKGTSVFTMERLCKLYSNINPNFSTK